MKRIIAILAIASVHASLFPGYYFRDTNDAANTALSILKRNASYLDKPSAFFDTMNEEKMNEMNSDLRFDLTHFLSELSAIPVEGMSGLAYIDLKTSNLAPQSLENLQRMISKIVEGWLLNLSGIPKLKPRVEFYKKNNFKAPYL